MMDDEKLETILDAVAQGFPPTLACGLVGLTPEEFRDCVMRDEDMRRRLIKSDSLGKFGLFLNLRQQAEMGNVTAARFLLERTAPEEFGPPKQVIETRRMSVDLNKPLASNEGPSMNLNLLTKEELATLQQLQEKVFTGDAAVDVEIE